MRPYLKLLAAAVLAITALTAHAAAKKPPATPAAPAAPAATSMLRVACEGDDVGAEVTVNGKFKGECPLDMQVAPGTLQLRVEKKDPSYDRIFEQEIRIGDGVVKRVEAVLSKNLNAAGQQRLREETALREVEREETARREAEREETARREEAARREAERELWQQAGDGENAQTLQVYLDKYPNGIHAAVASKKLNAIRNAATIYVYRESAYGGSGSAFAIYNERLKIGYPLNGSYFVYRAPSGSLTLSTDCPRTDSLAFSIEPGKTYYVEFSLGFIGCSFRLMSTNQGISAIKGLRKM